MEIVTDGGEQGLGHLRRSEALATHLRSTGWRSWLRPLSGEARRLVSAHNLDVAGDPDITVIDLPASGDQVLLEAEALGRPTLALDYVGELSPTLVINIFDRGSARGAGEVRSGLRYAIIRPEIAAAKQEQADHVLVMLGSQDLLGQSDDAAAAARSEGVPVVVVDGPLAPPRDAPAPVGVTRRRCPTDLPELMASCSWAVTNGGTSMLEMLHLGKPTIVLPQTEAEARLASEVLAAGALMGIGMDAIQRPGRDADDIGRRAAALVDGGGLQRIAAAVRELHRG